MESNKELNTLVVEVEFAHHLFPLNPYFGCYCLLPNECEANSNILIMCPVGTFFREISYTWY